MTGYDCNRCPLAFEVGYLRVLGSVGRVREEDLLSFGLWVQTTHMTTIRHDSPRSAGWVPGHPRARSAVWSDARRQETGWMGREPAGAAGAPPRVTQPLWGM
jgi:hypothetical protein